MAEQWHLRYGDGNGKEGKKMPVITLDCWTCRQKITGEANRHPQFAFELAQMAEQVGWIGHVDLQRGRTLVFCCESCRFAARTKAGHIRAKRPPIDPDYDVAVAEPMAMMTTLTPGAPTDAK